MYSKLWTNSNQYSSGHTDSHPNNHIASILWCYLSRGLQEAVAISPSCTLQQPGFRTEFYREVWCLSLWERESRRKITCKQSGSSRKYKSWGAGEQGGVLKCWKWPEKVNPREVCEACLLIFHIGSEGPTGFSHSALGREESIVIRSGKWDPEKNCREFELLAALGWRRELWTSKVSKPKTNGQMASARIWKFSFNDLNVCLP